MFSLLALLLLFSGCNSLFEASDTSNQIASTGFLMNQYTFEEPIISGAVYYIDPINGKSNADGGNGTIDNPWRTLQEVIEENLIEHYGYSESYNTESPLSKFNEGAPITGGDTLILKEGYHGHLSLNRFIFLEWLTIRGAPGENAVLSQIEFNGAFRKIYLADLSINKESYTIYEDPTVNYWEADAIGGSCLNLASSGFWGDGREIKIQNVKINTVSDSSVWSATDWIERASGGISLRGVNQVEIIDSKIENIRIGISFDYHSDYTWFVNNSIKNYSVDGARILSDYIYFVDNLITDCIDVDDNHDDAIQSYTRGEDNSVGTGIIQHVVIRGNTIIDSTSPNNELAGSPQGIGCFDGFYDNWLIENNLIITDTYHGISLYGANDCNIINNTVVDSDLSNNTSPWILIHDHKNGTPSTNCIIANNLVSRSVSSNSVQDVSNNIVIGHNNVTTMNEYFIDRENLDFHLKDSDIVLSDLVDKGKLYNGFISSEMDLDAKKRNNNPDVGSYEL